MINVIVIVNEDIGKKDYDYNVLYKELEELKKLNQLEFMGILEYQLKDRPCFDAFKNGMSAVSIPEDYAYVWEDENSPLYEEQHERYSKFKELLKDYI